jgi:cysteine-rich repeat protein
MVPSLQPLKGCVWKLSDDDLLRPLHPLRSLLCSAPHRSIDRSIDRSLPPTAASSALSVGSIDIHVEFSRVTGSYPQHFDEQPLLALDAANLGGLTFSDVTRACTGAYRTGYTCEEQAIAVAGNFGADTASSFQLSINATGQQLRGAIGVTPPIAADASAHAVTTALSSMTWHYLPSGFEDFALSQDNFEVLLESSSPQSAWMVRFFFAPNNEALKMTETGDVPLLTAVNVTSPSPVAVTVTERVAGAVPSSAMPVSATQAASAAGSAASEAAEAQVQAQASASGFVVEAVVHICGDGKRTTAEGCDDGGTAGGDGCSANCTVESGFLCSDAIGQLSDCEVPTAPSTFPCGIHLFINRYFKTNTTLRSAPLHSALSRECKLWSVRRRRERGDQRGPNGRKSYERQRFVLPRGVHGAGFGRGERRLRERGRLRCDVRVLL